MPCLCIIMNTYKDSFGLQNTFKLTEKQLKKATFEEENKYK